LVVS
jgi:Hypervirulence associated proteins TUDOR domain